MFLALLEGIIHQHTISLCYSGFWLKIKLHDEIERELGDDHGDRLKHYTFKSKM